LKSSELGQRWYIFGVAKDLKKKPHILHKNNEKDGLRESQE
jgi:hypothetical protein